MSTDVRVAANMVWDILKALTPRDVDGDPLLVDGQASGLVAYRGRIEDHEHDLVEAPRDIDGRYHPHAVVYFGAGESEPAPRRVGRPSINVDWTFQITCAGGDDNRALWAIAEVRKALLGKHLTVAGDVSSCIYGVGNPGPLRRDDDEDPPPLYLPLLFRVRI